MLSVAIVILNWNGRRLLEQYLPSVVRFSSEYDIYIADNGSTDDSISFLRMRFPTVKIIALDKNYGFTGGYNRALRQISADYYILLNDDVEVTNGWVSPVIELMEQDKKIAVCQPKLLSYTDKEKFEYAGAAGGYIDYLGYPFCAGRIFEKLEKDNGQYNNVREIFWATGAAMFVKSRIFHELNGLDEDFFAHMEEIDFCWRAKNMGYKVMYCPTSKVYHYGGGTLNKLSPQKTFLNFRNNLLLLYKNLPEKELSKVMRRRKCLDLLAAFVFLLTSSKLESKAVLKARREFMRLRDSFAQKRNSNVKNYPSQVYRKSLVLTSKILHKDLFHQIVGDIK
ncbi:MAG: glycosyltransferase family 2 protein [Bacteroidales bacterium]